MATKVDSSSPAESRRGQSTASSAVSASSPKVSMFGAKSGFVIPKNKLSGSLVPIFRGGSKVDAGNIVKEESTKQVQRKTKWGVDLTQDAAVRKGRALAYQARIEQITQQLNSGVLETGGDQSSQSRKQDSSQQSTTDLDDQMAKKFELLELEKQEIIGEILRLNPSYKAPHDYKPLLKEGKVPIPLKAYPGYNFIGLLLGPESNAQKRLEEETGAKIRVYGTKANTKEKREITQSDVTEAQGAYEELYVNVSADTYEKVDAAVSLIELLVTPVSGNAAVASKDSSSVTGDNTNISQQSRKDTSGYGMTIVTDVNQVVPQPMLLSAQSSQQQFQQQYSAPWFPTAPPNALPRPTTGFFPLSTPNNPVRFPSHGATPYLQPTSFGSAPRTSSSLVSKPQLPLQAMQQLPPNQVFLSQSQGMPGQQPPPAYPVMLAPPSSIPPASFPSSRPMLSGPMPPSRPSAPINQQPGFMARPLVTTPASPGNSSGWSSASPIVPPQRPNTTQMSPQPFNPHIIPQQTSLPPHPNMTHNVVRHPNVNFALATFPSQPTAPASFTPVRPQIGPVSVSSALPSSGAPLQALITPLTSIPSNTPSSVPRPLSVGSAPSAPIQRTPVSQPSSSPSASAPIVVQAMRPSQSVLPVISRPSGPVPSVSPGLAHSQLQIPQLPSAAASSRSGNVPNFSLINPPATSSIGTPPVPAPAPKPLRPSSGDFTFQPLRAQVPVSPTNPKTNSPSVAQNISPVPLAAPHAPSFRPASQIVMPTVGMQNVPLPSAVNLQRPTQAPILLPTPFPTNPTIIQPPPRFPFPNSNPVPPRSPATQIAPSRPTTPATQMGPPSFSPAPWVPTLSIALPARPPNFLQLHQNRLPTANRPGGVMIQNQQVGSVSGHVPSPSGGNQSYDPFSPTSISSAPPQQGGEPLKARKQETDAEYEDLMASFGVK